jgi:hypothetical protein
MFRYGFWRWGPYIPPVTDEAIFPTYRRRRLKIHSGWDCWVGFDFLSEDDATDAFLLEFVDRHLPDAENASEDRNIQEDPSA